MLDESKPEPPRAIAATDLPTTLNYPIIAIGDLHGQRPELERLVERLERLEEWSECALVFLGDFVDRGPDVRGTIELVLDLLQRRPGGSATLGNHDLALVRAARLDDGPPSDYWIKRYQSRYDHVQTFQSYLGRPAQHGADAWLADLDALKAAIPDHQRRFLASLPWVVEANSHLFLHCGLSPELTASPAEQVEALRRRSWDRAALRPIGGTTTEQLWEPEYPAWIGADRTLADSPLAYPGKTQVTGHAQVAQPQADAVRIRLDTSGGAGTLSACLLQSADAEPRFIQSD
jgi:serine/threonine protein phosphatase 1